MRGVDHHFFLHIHNTIRAILISGRPRFLHGRGYTPETTLKPNHQRTNPPIYDKLQRILLRQKKEI